MSEWTEGPKVDFQQLKETIYALDERIGVLEELTHRHDDTKRALADINSTLQHHREWLEYNEARLTEVEDHYSGIVEELERIEPSVTFTRTVDMKLKVCGEKSDTLDQHTCINPLLHDTPHKCDCGYEWGGVEHVTEFTATKLLSQHEYETAALRGQAERHLRDALEEYGPAEHALIGKWEPTFTYADGIACPAWILRGKVQVRKS